jgi:hypothetical protein
VEDAGDAINEERNRYLVDKALKLYQFDAGLRGAMPTIGVDTPFGSVRQSPPAPPPTKKPPATSAWNAAATAPAPPPSAGPAAPLVPEVVPSGPMGPQGAAFPWLTETGAGPAQERAPIRAEMVNGKLVFTNQASLGGQDVGYDAGVNQWQDRALVDQELLANSRGEAMKRAVGYGPGNESGGGYDGPALRRPEDSRFRDFTIQRTPERAPGPVRADQTGFRGSYIPSAPVPDVAGLDQTGFEQKMAEMTKSASPGAQDEFKQRYLEQEGIRQEIARRALTEGQTAQAQGQGAKGQAEAALTGEQTNILRSPEADAIRRGVANAETIIAFKGRLDKDAAAAVQAKYGDKLTETLNILVKSGLAPTPQAALMKLIGVEYDALLMGNPEIKIAMTKATGGILSGGVS